jgi:hypothetical protein
MHTAPPCTLAWSLHLRPVRGSLDDSVEGTIAP